MNSSYNDIKYNNLLDVYSDYLVYNEYYFQQAVVIHRYDGVNE